MSPKVVVIERARAAAVYSSVVLTIAAGWTVAGEYLTAARLSGCSDLRWGRSGCAMSRSVVVAALPLALAAIVPVALRLAQFERRIFERALLQMIRNAMVRGPGPTPEDFVRRIVLASEGRGSWPRTEQWSSDLKWLEGVSSESNRSYTAVSARKEGEQRIIRLASLLYVARIRAVEVSRGASPLEAGSLGALERARKGLHRARQLLLAQHAVLTGFFVIVVEFGAAAVLELVHAIQVVCGLQRAASLSKWALDDLAPARLLVLSVSLGAVGASLLVSLVAGWFAERSETDLDDVLIGLGRMPMYAAGMLLAGAVYGRNVPSSWRAFIRGLQAGAVQNRPILGVAIAIASAVGVLLVNRVILVWIARHAARSQQTFDDAFVAICRLYGTLVIIAAAGAVELFIFRHSVSTGSSGVNVFLPYALLVSVVTAVLGLVTQEGTANFVSGIMMQIDRPFALGDVVRLSTGELCYVRQFGVRATRLVDVFENTEITVPNRVLAASPIANLARPNPQLGISVTVAVRPEVMERASGVLMLAARRCSDVCHADMRAVATSVEALRIHLDVAAGTEFGPASSGAVLGVLCSDLKDRVDSADRKARAVASETWDASHDAAIIEIQQMLSGKSRFSSAFFRAVNPLNSAESGSTVARDSVRYSEDAKAVADYLSLEPGLSSEFSRDGAGDPMVVIKLRVFAEALQRREELTHELNLRIVEWFRVAGVPFELVESVDRH